jgi:hypothetical protein
MATLMAMVNINGLTVTHMVVSLKMVSNMVKANGRNRLNKVR